MNRRRFLVASAGFSLATRFALGKSGGDSRNFVNSEVGDLQRVIVHPPGPETRKAFPMFYGGHSMLTWELLREEAAAQHQAFVEQLTNSGAEVLLFEDLLSEAIENARKKGVFGTWLKDEIPQLVKFEKDLTATAILGGNDKFVYRRDETGAWQPIATPATTLFFTRDTAVMTPRGVILCNFNNERRALETKLMRFLFQHCASLKAYPILFDAMEEQVYVQGGDVMVMDATTLLVGVGNTTQEKTAVLLARKLNMDVITVQLPRGDRISAWDGLQTIFYHLDCLISFVDRRKVLAVPYLLEKEHVDRNPLLDVLYGLARIERLDKADRVNLIHDVRSVGWIRRYKAGSGDRDASLGATKLVDFLKAEGYQVSYVGGEPAPRDSDLKHLVERVVRECRFMAANVVAVKPGRVVSYEGNSGTQSALLTAGVQVTTFPSHELVRANGGPHCLTMPLQRAGL